MAIMKKPVLRAAPRKKPAMRGAISAKDAALSKMRGVRSVMDVRKAGTMARRIGR